MRKICLLSSFTAAVCLLINVGSAFAQGTSFSYQGQLTQAGLPVNGVFDFQFALFHDNGGSNIAAGPVTSPGILVTDGVFLATIDFGPVFTGGDLWLQVGTRTNGGGSFSLLSPLQHLTPSPYAIFAAGASNLVGVLPGGSLAGAYPDQLNLLNPSNQFTGTFTSVGPGAGFVGNGAGLSNVTAATLGGLGVNDFWKTTGNAGTTAGPNFLGTTDNQPLELHVNGQRALRLEPTASVPNVVAGFPANSVAIGVQGATIGGGGAPPSFANQVSSILGTVAGGSGNVILANANDSTIAGGRQNEIGTNAWGSFIGGGHGNLIQGGAFPGGFPGEPTYCTIGGGYGNTILAGADHSVIAGGFENTIEQGTVRGFIGAGRNNTIQAFSGDGVIVGGSHNGILVLDTNYPASFSFIGGGYQNTNIGWACVIGGGETNFTGLFADHATIGGGGGNVIIGSYFLPVFDTIAGGAWNLMGTNTSFDSIGGGATNIIQAGSTNCTIAGGGGNVIFSNTANATISGGQNNSVGTNAQYSTIGGGYFNQSYSQYSTVGGGQNNSIGGAGSAPESATIAGGSFNEIAVGAPYASIGGGNANIIHFNAYGATIPGGIFNEAYGTNSFAAGNQAKAFHQGTFVWADSQNSPFSSTTTNQFIVRAAGGVGLGTSETLDSGLSLGFNMHLNDNPLYLRPTQDHHHGLAYCGPTITNFAPAVLPDGPVLWGYAGGVLGIVSGGERAVLSWNSSGVQVAGPLCAASFSTCSDRNLKENFEQVSPAEVLDKVASLPISRWNFKQNDSATHIGPMAQDFFTAFEVGSDDRHIGMGDEGGVALAAIQGLNEKLQAKDAEIQMLRERLGRLEKLVDAISSKQDGEER